jgi:hypothetical protein
VHRDNVMTDKGINTNLEKETIVTLFDVRYYSFQKGPSKIKKDKILRRKHSRNLANDIKCNLVHSITLQTFTSQK